MGMIKNLILYTLKEIDENVLLGLITAAYATVSFTIVYIVGWAIGVGLGTPELWYEFPYCVVGLAFIIISTIFVNRAVDVWLIEW